MPATATPQQMATAALALAGVTDSYGEWVRENIPETVETREPAEWTAPHFCLMQKTLDRVTAGELKRVIFQVPIRHGKALALDTPIPTPDGWAAVGDLRVGDVVFDERGEPCNVTWLSPIFRDRHVFKVSTDDGDELVADEAHEWRVAITPGRRRGAGRGENTDKESGRALSIRETRWLAKREAEKGLKPYVPPAGALNLPDADLPVDPWVLGAWLGDGHVRGGQITISHKDAGYMVPEIEAAGFAVSPMPSMQTKTTGTYTILGLRGGLVEAGLLKNRQRGENGEKHIPAEYMRASAEQRLALLQGLVDTDGYVAKRGQVEFCATDRGLALQVQELVRSMGRKCSLNEGRATIDGRDCGPKYRVMFYMAGAARMPRKAERCRDSTHRPGRYLSFEYAGRADTRCIEVDSPSHLFLAGRGMTPTRNTEHNTYGFTAYHFERNPRFRALLCSYNQTQAQKFSRNIRRLVRSLGVALSPERDAAGEWETVTGGGLRAVGAGAGVASVNADGIIIDDPIGSRDEAESPAHRARVYDWLTNDILARAEPHTWVILTMSRWHKDDPVGRLLDQQGERWHVVDLPALAEPTAYDKDGAVEYEDPLGRDEGEALWPEIRPQEWLQDKRVEMGTYGFASLLQGRPRPREGGMFKWDWWQTFKDAPVCGRLVRYWDLAGTRVEKGKNDPDYSAGTLAGRMADTRTAIVHQVAFRKSVAERDAELERIARDDKAKYGQNVEWWLETEAGIAGKDRTAAIIRRLHAIGMKCSDEPATGSKEIRAEPLASAAEAGNVVLGPDDPDNPWWDAFRLEAADFPNSTHDDRVDSAAGAYNKVVLMPPPNRAVVRPLLT